MRVKLARTWFTPMGERLKKGVHSIDDSLANRLPPGAQVLEEPSAPASAPKGKNKAEPELEL